MSSPGIGRLSLADSHSVPSRLRGRLPHISALRLPELPLTRVDRGPPVGREEETRAARTLLEASLVGCLTLVASLIHAPSALAASPANDNFASPTALLASGTSLFGETTLYATAQPNEPAHAGQAALLGARPPSPESGLPIDPGRTS